MELNKFKAGSGSVIKSIQRITVTPSHAGKNTQVIASVDLSKTVISMLTDVSACGTAGGGGSSHSVNYARLVSPTEVEYSFSAPYYSSSWSKKPITGYFEVIEYA